MIKTIKNLLKEGKITEALDQFKALEPHQQEEMFKDFSFFLTPPTHAVLLFRKLKDGKSYEDFHEAWLPPLKDGEPLSHYFPIPTYVINGIKRDDPKEIASIGLVWVQDSNLEPIMDKMLETEKIRHEKISQVADKIGPTQLYKIKDRTQLGCQNSLKKNPLGISVPKKS